jgi:putative endonuclease
LKSSTSRTHYYGSTADLGMRLKRHNGGKVKSTKGKKPWVLHYYEEFDERGKALKRERFFKSVDGYKYLKEKGVI